MPLMALRTITQAAVVLVQDGELRSTSSLRRVVRVESVVVLVAAAILHMALLLVERLVAVLATVQVRPVVRPPATEQPIRVVVVGVELALVRTRMAALAVRALSSSNISFNEPLCRS